MPVGHIRRFVLPHSKAVLVRTIVRNKNLDTTDFTHIILTVRDHNDRETINFLTGEPDMAASQYDSILKNLREKLARQKKIVEETENHIASFEKLQDAEKTKGK